MSSLTHAIGGIFQPILKFIADILAFFFALIPSYPVAVALLTIVVMAALTPLTVKSTKNMAAMQALGPEMKKLQQKYKGPGEPDAAQRRNDEALQRAQGQPGIRVSTDAVADAVLLHAVQRHPGYHQHGRQGRGRCRTPTHSGGLRRQQSRARATSTVCADPRYISQTSKMYQDIVMAHGQLLSGGINFAAKLLSHHSSPVGVHPLRTPGARGRRPAVPADVSTQCPEPAGAIRPIRRRP